MSDLIAALDNALAGGRSEEFILRRVVGSGANVANIDVTCIGAVDPVTETQIIAGIAASDLIVTFSPTQINDAQWPGGTIPVPPPFDIDPRIPRALGQDKAIVGGKLRQIVFVKPFMVGGELVRIEMRVTG